MQVIKEPQPTRGMGSPWNPEVAIEMLHRAVPTLSQHDLEKHLWGSADILRGHVDAGKFKDYIFALLFYRRLCDVWDEKVEVLLAETGIR